MFLCKNLLKLWLFVVFCGDKDDHINVWIVKILIITTQMDVTFSSLKNRQHEKTMFVPKCGFLNNFNGLVNLPLPDKHALLVQKHVANL